MAIIVKDDVCDTYLAVRALSEASVVVAQKDELGDVHKLFLGISDVKALHAALGAILADESDALTAAATVLRRYQGSDSQDTANVLDDLAAQLGLGALTPVSA